MICPKCNVEMVKGQAIHPKGETNARYFAPFDKILKHNEVHLIPVLKCPKCGFSDDDLTK